MTAIAWAIVAAACILYKPPDNEREEDNNSFMGWIWFICMWMMLAITIHTW